MHHRPFRSGLAAVTAAAAFTLAISFAEDALPDLIPIADASHNYIYGWHLDAATEPGRVLLRLTVAEGNIGAGPLEIWGGTTEGSKQDVYQRVYARDGSIHDRLAGSFEYHPDHGHVHFEGFAQYNLRLITPGQGLGAVISSGGKTSYCLQNSLLYWPDVALQALVPLGRGGASCGPIQGISPGFSDTYASQLPGQFIDVTHVPSGHYWLEVMVDPDNAILESNEENNVARIEIEYRNPHGVGENDAPTLVRPKNQLSQRGGRALLEVTASDPQGSGLHFRATGLPLGLVIHPNTGAVFGEVAANARNVYTTEIVVSDGELETSATFTWVIEDPPDGVGLTGEYFAGRNFQTPLFTRLDPRLDLPLLVTPRDARLPSTGFSVRWSGKLLPRHSERHTFSARINGGIRLWVNDEPLIDRIGQPAGGAYSGSVFLQAGQLVPIMIEYQDDGNGYPVFQMTWSSLSQPAEEIPAERLFPLDEQSAPLIYPPGDRRGAVGESAYLPINATDRDADALSYEAVALPPSLAIDPISGVITGVFARDGDYDTIIRVSDGTHVSEVTFAWVITPTVAGSGLTGGYFLGRDWEVPAAAREDAVIDFDWSRIPPPKGVDVGRFSARWDGQIVAEFSETYQFHVTSSNGARLWVDSNLLLYEWTGSSGAPNAGSWTVGIPMRAGVRVPIRLEYYHTRGDAHLRLEWSSLSQPRQVVPAGRLFPSRHADDHEPETYAAWAERSMLGLPFDLTAPEADPDGDHQSNLVEYALGLDPRRTTASPVFLFRENGAWAARFPKAAHRPPGLSIVLERSSDLRTWEEWGPLSEEGHTDRHEFWTAKVPAKTGSQVFARLKATAAGP